MKIPGVSVVLGFLAGALAASLAFLVFYSPSTANMQVREETTTAVNNDGTAIGLADPKGAGGEGYVIAGAMWRESGGGWSDRFPTRLKPLSSGDQVRLGSVRAEPNGAAPGRTVVVWLECLGKRGPDWR